MMNAAITLAWLSLAYWTWSLLAPTWKAAMRPAPDQIIDYYQDWGSARNYWTNLPVYTQHTTSIPRHLALLSNPVRSIEYNAHPPTSVLLGLPLGCLAYPDAVFLWNVISLAALAASLTILAIGLAVPWKIFLPTLALLPLCLPVLGNLQMGQLTLVLTAIVTAIWFLDRSGRIYSPGILLGCATAIKLFPAYLLVYYAARRQFQLVFTAICTVLVLTVATTLILGTDTYRDYMAIVLPRLRTFQGFGYNLSVAGFWHKLFDPHAEITLTTHLRPSLTLAHCGTIVSDLVLTLIVASLAYRAKTLAQRDLAFSAAVTAMLLASPVAWDITLLLLLVPIAVIARTTYRPSWVPIALTFVVTAIWLPQPLLTLITTGGGRINVTSLAFVLGAASVKFYALLAVFSLALATFYTQFAHRYRCP
jgi:hypothetical protein